MKKSKKKKRHSKEKKEAEGLRAAAVCGRIRVVSREGGLLRRNQALMDKGH